MFLYPEQVSDVRFLLALVTRVLPSAVATLAGPCRHQSCHDTLAPRWIIVFAKIVFLSFARPYYGPGQLLDQLEPQIRSGAFCQREPRTAAPFWPRFPTQKTAQLQGCVSV